MRDGKWKAYVNADGKDLELYDLQADPEERENMAEKETATGERLKGLMLAWKKTLP